MSRLIDADALIKKLQEKSVADGVNTISTTYTYKELVYIICNQPTAYDLDKAAAELEIHRQVDFNYHIRKDYRDIVNDIYGKTIEIVRKGGIDGVKRGN